MKYRSVQTGPKSQLGGENGGLVSVAYQVGIAAVVKGVPSMPTSSQATTEIISLGRSFILMKVWSN